MFRVNPESVPPKLIGLVLVWLAAVAGYSGVFGQQTQLQSLRNKYDGLEEQFHTYQTSAHPEATKAKELSEDFADLGGQFDELANSSNKDALQHGLYWGGWSHYYSGVLASQLMRSRSLERSRRCFIEFLDMADVDRDQWSAELLGLEYEAMCLGVYGLALADLAAGNEGQAMRCFAYLEDDIVSPEYRRQRHLWRVQAALYSRHREMLEREFERMLQEADDKLRQSVDKSQPNRKNPIGAETQASYMVAMQALRQPASINRRLGMIALEKFLDWKRADIVEKILDDLQLEIHEGSDELQLRSARGWSFTAPTGAGPWRSTRMLGVIRPPLGRLWSRGLDELNLECRVLLAFSLFKLKQNDKAAAEVKQCIEAVAEERALGRPWKKYQDTLQKAAMLQLTVLKQLSETADEEEQERIVQSLKFIRQNQELFGRNCVQLAAYQLSHVQQKTASADQIIAWLDEIGTDNATMYRSAQFDKTTVRYRDWRDSAPTERAGKRRVLEDSARAYWRNTSRDTNPTHDVQVVIRVAEACLAEEPPDVDGTQHWLEKSAEWSEAAQAAIPHANIVDLRHLRLRLAQTQQDDTQIHTHARWLAENAAGTPFEINGLTVLCQRWDKRTDDLTPEERESARADHHRLLVRLQEAAEREGGSLFDMDNAKSVASKHAHIAVELGKHAEAAASLDLLARAFPAQVEFSRRAAGAHYEAKQYEKSCQHWRELLKRLDEQKHGELWYEAKYYLIDCLAHSDKQRAAEVLDQFLALYAPVRIPLWRGRFDKLRADLGESQNSPGN